LSRVEKITRKCSTNYRWSIFRRATGKCSSDWANLSFVQIYRQLNCGTARN